MMQSSTCYAVDVLLGQIFNLDYFQATSTLSSYNPSAYYVLVKYFEMLF